MIIDATDTILGRMASIVAKKALQGEEITIINAEKAVISGSHESVFMKYKFKNDVGDQIKGPFMSRMSDRLVRRVIRGMLPWHSSRGRAAFKKIHVFIGNPENVKGAEKLKEISSSALKNLRYVHIEEISKHLGA
ncbi:MAG: 50S ribosomal protein L13 [Nanoarchaeota archaeon]|nr:50S ribosomal protein L13 [Nanoarchaeota archaeon]MBU4300344.1 50S ribosomal protein L13 [Nanoarchaeota archaeon]MBU4452133.1 50S ribosomal protein L13 [Nanoarchaeota archaeon]MCG2724265.1 50S ribosomal protein L13 [archaeon]